MENAKNSKVSPLRKEEQERLLLQMREESEKLLERAPHQEEDAALSGEFSAGEGAASDGAVREFQEEGKRKILEIFEKIRSFTQQVSDVLGPSEFISEIREITRKKEEECYFDIGKILARSTLGHRSSAKLGIPIQNIILSEDIRSFVSENLDAIEGGQFGEVEAKIVEIDIRKIEFELLDSASFLLPVIRLHREILEDESFLGEEGPIKAYDRIFNMLKREALNTDDLLCTVFN